MKIIKGMNEHGSYYKTPNGVMLYYKTPEERVIAFERCIGGTVLHNLKGKGLKGKGLKGKGLRGSALKKKRKVNKCKGGQMCELAMSSSDEE